MHSNFIALYFLGLSWMRKIELQNKTLRVAMVFFSKQLCTEESRMRQPSNESRTNKMFPSVDKTKGEN